MVSGEGEGAGSECGMAVDLECGVEAGAGLEFGEIAGVEEL